MAGEDIKIKYRFVLKDGRQKEFDIELEGHSLTRMVMTPEHYPDWTALTFHQCSNCPLKLEYQPQCPVAVGLIDLVDFFRDSISYEEVDVYVETNIRNYHRHITMQEGLSAMIGLCMATSGCPVLEKLKPMARFHLPFADEQETMYRAMSTYLMAQFFNYRRGGTPDWEMKNLIKMYDDIRIVNKHLAQRLSDIKVKDASLNAIIKLDCFAISLGFTVTQETMEDFEPLFNAYLQ